MATAYLLASVLTLIVVLVHGQEAFPEQGNIVVVAEDSFEDELNSFTDLILPGSANTRAECIQKKKCKNKGGTCQNKGNTCPGKFVKGCSKGCSCCLPEEISCKPSKRCKRANGACIARGECNGKIISTGCKKPRSCKKTHVCCVQDETTTEVPTCRGPSCPLPGTCPKDAFETKHVCSDCEDSSDALDYVISGKPPTKGNVRDVFTGLLKYNEVTQGKLKLCLVINPTEVLSWKCIPKANNKKEWDTCVDIGYCTNLRSLLSDGHFVYDDKICYHVHVGKIWDDKCETLKKKITNPHTAATCMKECKKEVAAGCNAFNFNYKVGEPCILKKCPTDSYPDPIPSTDGYDAYYHAGYYAHFGMIWEDQCITLKTIIIDPDTAANCMKKCTKNADTGHGCNAFNYKVGESCVLKRCSTPYPNTTKSTDGYDAYYWLPESTAAKKNIANDEE